MLVGSDHFRARAVGERAAGTAFGQMKLTAAPAGAGFVSHFHPELARGAGAGSVNASFASTICISRIAT